MYTSTEEAHLHGFFRGVQGSGVARQRIGQKD